jgi:ribosomal protein S18 acetylase RimI-like enzyme
MELCEGRRGGVVDLVTEAAGPVEAHHRPGFRDMHILTDARILKHTVRESILTSPGSFLKTVADVDAMRADYWDKEINTSTWVIMKQFGKVVGIAVARSPDVNKDNDIDPMTTRFIESVWIVPKFRGKGMGEQLVSYLMQAEHGKYPSVSHFKLWVFEDNIRAIHLYERMNFKYVDKHALEDGRIELNYEYTLPNLA